MKNFAKIKADNIHCSLFIYAAGYIMIEGFQITFYPDKSLQSFHKLSGSPINKA